MSCRRDRPDGIDFCHAARNFKIRVRRQDGRAPRFGKELAVSRRRISSVPVGAMIAALAVIAVVALVALYLGNGAVLTGLPEDPAVESEAKNH